MKLIKKVKLILIGIVFGLMLSSCENNLLQADDDCYDYLGDLDSLYVLLTTYPPKLRKIFDIVKWCCDVIINRYTI